jgi:phytoene synthase
MSDTANPANLASSEEFDARLKRTDEDRWLATRYAPPASRERLVAIYLFNQELQRTLHAKEPMLGKIRLQWWRETLEQVGGKGALRRHDLAEELARVTKDRPDLIAPMNDLIDRFDDIIDDHMHGGHTTGGDHEARHLAAEGALARLAGLALDPTAAPEHLHALGSAGEAHVASIAELASASGKWATAKEAVRQAPAQLWPAILHLAAASEPGKLRSPLSKRWRMFRAALTRRL